MQTVANRLAAQLHDLRYQHAVQHISWGSGSLPPGGDDTSSGVSSRVSIACANGATLEADVALITLPLGVLKAQHQQLFSPPLPPAKAAAIERLRIGTVDKLFLDFTPPTGGSSQAPPAAAAGGGGKATGGGEAGPVVSYALLWSSPWEGAGSSSSSAAGPLAAAPGEAELPEWIKGVFSLRFGGPEVKWSQAASSSGSISSGSQAGEQEEAEQAPAGAGDDEYNPCAEVVQPTCYQAVAWLSGAAATAMEAATDEEVLAALRRLPQLFPQLQLPPGASWGAIKVHR